LLNVISGLLAGGVAASTNSYESIATVTVGSGGSSTITFSSIPSTYKHLQIRAIARETDASGGIQISQMRFNGDSGNNYARHRVGGNGSSASATAASSVSSIWVCAMWSSADLANDFGAAVIDILDYANTSKNKTVRSLEGLDNNGGGVAGEVSLRSGLWQSTSAVTSITLTSTATGYTQYSSFALYGIKG